MVTEYIRVKMASLCPADCRFCCCAIHSKHYTALFSAGSLSKYLPGHMGMNFDVSVSEND